MKKIFYCYLIFCFIALCFAGCDKRIINTNNNIPLDKTISNTTIPAPSVHNVLHGTISRFSSVCRLLKDHYFITITSTVIVIAGSYHFLKNKPDAIIITLFKRDATHVAENAEQINEYYKLSKKLYPLDEQIKQQQDFISLQKKIAKNLNDTVQNIRQIIDVKKLATDQGLQQINEIIEKIKIDLEKITNQNEKQFDMNNDILNDILNENRSTINDAISIINNTLKSKFIKYLPKDKERRLIIKQQNKIFDARNTKKLRQKIAKEQKIKNYPLSFPYPYFAIKHIYQDNIIEIFYKPSSPK
ncbi:MAG: hypothetical protein LBN01_01790 [Endomicrobium sp.]|jgi:hypothetical protein|nr:hypothetical protein [Endomicrobium sp.]